MFTTKSLLVLFLLSKDFKRTFNWDPDDLNTPTADDVNTNPILSASPETSYIAAGSSQAIQIPIPPPVQRSDSYDAVTASLEDGSYGMFSDLSSPSYDWLTAPLSSQQTASTHLTNSDTTLSSQFPAQSVLPEISEGHQQPQQSQTVSASSQPTNQAESVQNIPLSVAEFLDSPPSSPNTRPETAIDNSLSREYIPPVVGAGALGDSSGTRQTSQRTFSGAETNGIRATQQPETPGENFYDPRFDGFMSMNSKLINDESVWKSIVDAFPTETGRADHERSRDSTDSASESGQDQSITFNEKRPSTVSNPMGDDTDASDANASQTVILTVPSSSSEGLDRQDPSIINKPQKRKIGLSQEISGTSSYKRSRKTKSKTSSGTQPEVVSQSYDLISEPSTSQSTQHVSHEQSDTGETSEFDDISDDTRPRKVLEPSRQSQIVHRRRMKILANEARRLELHKGKMLKGMPAAYRKLLMDAYAKVESGFQKPVNPNGKDLQEDGDSGSSNTKRRPNSETPSAIYRKTIRLMAAEAKRKGWHEGGDTSGEDEEYRKELKNAYDKNQKRLKVMAETIKNRRIENGQGKTRKERATQNDMSNPKVGPSSNDDDLSCDVQFPLSRKGVRVRLSFETDEEAKERYLPRLRRLAALAVKHNLLKGNTVPDYMTESDVTELRRLYFMNEKRRKCDRLGHKRSYDRSKAAEMEDESNDAPANNETSESGEESMVQDVDYGAQDEGSN